MARELHPKIMLGDVWHRKWKRKVKEEPAEGTRASSTPEGPCMRITRPAICPITLLSFCFCYSRCSASSFTSCPCFATLQQPGGFPLFSLCSSPNFPTYKARSALCPISEPSTVVAEALSFLDLSYKIPPSCPSLAGSIL